ncbi:MAG: lytic transglycosylase domain-containing protein [Chloroflexi bacterium]|nr:lytic transglycosylase domain-containing protein [Chloroflexota bacterium]
MDPEEFLILFAKIAADYDLDKHLLAEQAWRESRWNPLAVGRSRDMGIMQIIPSTWQKWSKKVGVYDPFDPESNIRVGAAFLASLKVMLNKDLSIDGDHWMLVAYNWGPINVRRLIEGGKGWLDVPQNRRDYATDILLAAETRKLSSGEPVQTS